MVRVRIGNSEVLLGEGRHFIGRGPECRVQIDHPRISRRHARIVVGSDSATIADLDSANGTHVDGRRISREPVPLRSGARVLVADVELRVSFEADIAGTAGPARRIAAPVEPDEFAEDASTSTHTTDFFALVEKIVAGMFAEGRFDEAAAILNPQLDGLLADARANRPIPSEQLAAGLGYAVGLAEATGSRRWVHYVLDLMTALAHVPDDSVAERLARAIAKAEGFDTSRLAAYSKALESRADPLSRMRAAAQLRSYHKPAR